MYEISDQFILDRFGKSIVENVRDGALAFAVNIANQSTNNKIDLDYYSCFLELTPQQKEKVCDLLSETVTDTIYRFLKMFEEKEDEMQLLLLNDEETTDLLSISEDVGAEITFCDEDGWISRFSKIGMIVDR